MHKLWRYPPTYVSYRNLKKILNFYSNLTKPSAVPESLDLNEFDYIGSRAEKNRHFYTQCYYMYHKSLLYYRRLYSFIKFDYLILFGNATCIACQFFLTNMTIIRHAVRHWFLVVICFCIRNNVNGPLRLYYCIYTYAVEWNRNFVKFKCLCHALYGVVCLFGFFVLFVCLLVY